MKKVVFVLAASFAFQAIQAQLFDEMCWRYVTPAAKFWEGLPIGTGRFAAMVAGKTENEVIPFNDETLWTGGPYNPNNPDGPEIVKKIREFAFMKDWSNTRKECFKLGSDPEMVQLYQPMGRLNLTFQGHDKAVNYSRKLSMDSALVSISYQVDGIGFKREVFASYPDQVIVVRITASKASSINFSGFLSSLQPSAISHFENNDFVMTGTTIDNTTYPYKFRILPSEMKWQSRLRIIADGGSVTAADSTVQVKDAHAVTLILAGATNWVNWNDVSANEKERCDNYIANASKYSYKQLKQRHIEDYCPLFSACKIDLGKNENSKLTTTERMEKLRKGEDDPLYISQYFQYGRYLLLAGARENTLAFNNHNIWLDDMEGRWRGRWTLNINIEVCYWPVENTNLPNVNGSLLLFVENLAQAGKRTATELYGCSGWTAHHGTDVWFNTAPTDGDPNHATWPMSGAWLMQQLYDHYLYEPNDDYLKKIYPLLKGSAGFFNDFLIRDPETGWFVTCPSTSPENGALIDNEKQSSGAFLGSTMDNAIIRNLFTNCIAACKKLNIDQSFRIQLEDKLAKLPPYQVGKFGQLQEWLYDYKEAEVTHRHLSHLFGVYPGDDITLRSTPELADAVKIVLQRRGNINQGWSGAWKINLHARLEEPEKAYGILRKMITDVSLHPQREDSRVTPSFEGNQGIQGITSGIAEMLMQSHSGEISLLPALPKQWVNGSIEGLRAKGGYDIDLSWENGKINKALILSRYDNNCKIRTRTPVKILCNGKSIKTNRPEKNVLQFDAETGKEYELTGM